MTAILSCEGVTKRYGGLTAVKDLTFSVRESEVFAIIGPNGAGKTTLFDSISGISPITHGKIRLHGHEIHGLRPHEICGLGVARTFQTPVAFETQNVLANALIGGTFGVQGGGRLPLHFRAEAVDRALLALERCGLIEKQALPASALSVFDKKKLMLATALAAQPKLLLVDEPMGGLNRGEREEMIALVRQVNKAGISVLLIEHVIKAVQALADRILVLHHGEKIAEGLPAEVLRDEKVIAVYLGKPPAGPSSSGARGAA